MTLLCFASVCYICKKAMLRLRPMVPILMKTNYSNWSYFFITFLLFTLHLLFSRYTILYYDSIGYWESAWAFDKNGEGTFSIYNFDNALRGYFMGLLYYPLVLFTRGETSDYTINVIKLTGALQAGLLFGVACPALWREVTKTVLAAWQRLLFVLICLWLWRDHFNFILTDFPACLALVAALLCAYRGRGWWHSLLAGALIAAAMYMRPVYLISTPFVLALLLQRQYQAGELRRYASLMLNAAVFIGSFLLVGLPQHLINKNNYQSNSFLPLGRSEYYMINGEYNLYLWHLNHGLLIQRYETNVGTEFPKPQIVYLDPSGKALLGDRQLDSYPEYFLFALQRPFDMLALYARHLFNGLDVLYASPHVTKVYGNRISLELVNYTVIFFALVMILANIQHLRLQYVLLLLVIILPCLASMPLVVECRFFIPLHLTLYALACFGWSGSFSWRLAPKRVAALSICYGLFLIVCFTLSSNTQAMLDVGPGLLHL